MLRGQGVEIGEDKEKQIARYLSDLTAPQRNAFEAQLIRITVGVARVRIRIRVNVGITLSGRRRFPVAGGVESAVRQRASILDGRLGPVPL